MSNTPKYHEWKQDDDFIFELEKEHAETKSPYIKEPFYFKYKNSYLVIDRPHKEILDAGIKGVMKSFDFVYAFTGMEGSAKTSLVVLSMCYIAYVTRRTFDETDICFSLEQFDKKLESARIGEMISLDEFVLMGSSDDTMSKLQKLLRKKFTLIRKRRLFIFLVMPSIHMMNKYFAIDRIRGLVNCRVHDFQRGFADFYGKNKKDFLAVVGRRNFSYTGFQKDGTFNFINVQDVNIVKEPVIDWSKYEARKDEAIKSLNDDKEEADIKMTQRLKLYIVRQLKIIECLRNKDWSWKEVSKGMGTTESLLKDWYGEWSKNPTIQIELEEKYGKKQTEKVCESVVV